jgi:hypothetical protein
MLFGFNSLWINYRNEKEINIVETMSCWTDTIFIVDEKDIEKSVKILSF